MYKSQAGVGGKWGLGFPNTILPKWLRGSAIAIFLFLRLASPQVVSEILEEPRKRTRAGKGGQSKEEKPAEELGVKGNRNQEAHLSESCGNQIL